MLEPVRFKLRMLVCIASYGTGNDIYLASLIAAYRALPYSTHLVVLSNVPKYLGDDIEVIVGLPTRDPWSLPFGHKRIFAERIDDYDLFVYSEDDTLITQDNIDAFLRVSDVLAGDEIAGFFRYELDVNGNKFFPEVHGSYHWDARSVRSRGALCFAFFTNEHAACYILSREQLHRAIESGGFLVEPYQGKYGLPETAATDPYTNCGLTKLICISHFEDFLVHHLPNKYIGKVSLSQKQFHYQIDELLRIAEGSGTPTALLTDHSEFKASNFGKDYYEPIQAEVVSLVPASARSVLSIGCGWGATEEELTRGGKRVQAVPLDSVISACAEARGIETVRGDLKQALANLSGQKFDCIIVSNILHLLDDPASAVALLAPLLGIGGKVITSVPNVFRISVFWRKLRGVNSFRFLGNYSKCGVHLASHWTIRQWLRSGGLNVERIIDVLPQRPSLKWRSLSILKPILASKLVALASRD
jgi:2-polyprenyl-3-methyl-5-hydroxy-6-metoxy-1,4-benzoquinol methylase